MYADLYRHITKNPCVYKFINATNGKIYIGKSICLQKRIKGHLEQMRNKDHRGSLFIKALIKYGYESFRLETIEEYPSLNNFIRKHILIREKFWIGFYNSLNRDIGYNLILGDMSNGDPITEETRKRMSLAQKGKPSPNKGKTGPLAIWSWGRNPSEETRKKLREANLGKKRPKHISELTKKQRLEQEKEDKILIGDKLVCPLIAAAIRKTSKPVKQVDPKTGLVIRVWNSISEAARSFDGNIRTVISGIQSATTQRCGCKQWNGFGWLIAKDINDYEPIDISFFKRKKRVNKPKSL